MSQPWRIELLGGLRLGKEGRWLPLEPRKPAVLLAALACSAAQPLSREALTERLWPESDPQSARLNLRAVLHALRDRMNALGPAGEPLLVSRTTICLNTDQVAIDVSEFRAALRTAGQAGDLPGRTRALEAAVALYRGELLPDLYEPWVLEEREHLAALYLQALHELTNAREAAGELEGALAAARQAVHADPLREEAHYDLMRLYAATGQPAACLRQYEELERRLREEIGETPSVEARALAEELRRQARTLVVARRSPRAPNGETGRTNAGETETTEPLPLTPSPPHSPTPAPRLPAQLTRFFGREEETAQLAEWLASGVTRLVTATGPAGSGKTRLAVAVAGRLKQQFGSAVAFVPLVDRTEAGQLMEAIADAMGLVRVPGLLPAEQVFDHLQYQPWLLVLDNFEHLVETGAGQVRGLLERAETVTCLVTSQQRLGLAAEQEFALLPLPTPRGLGARSWELGLDKNRLTGVVPNSQLLTPNSLMSYPSVQLFVDRARAARPDFRLTDANAAAVAELCDRLEGLPLAIELAAARVNALAPTQMLAQLEQRFQFLVSRQRDVPRRHRTLRAAIDSSVQLLPPELQGFFARLAVFRGGWTLEAAAVCGDPGAGCCVLGAGSGTTEPTPHPAALSTQNPEPSTLACLEQLRDCSLIQVEERGEAVRYRLLETLREYAWEQLTAAGVLAVARSRHRDWYLQLAEQADAAQYRPERKQWLTRLEAELDNLRAALGWCQEEADTNPEGSGAEAGLRLAVALGELWISRGYLTEGLQWLEGLLARSSQLPAAVRARALRRAAYLAYCRGDREQSRTFFQAARQEYEQVLALARQEGNRAAVAQALLSLAAASAQDEDLDAAWTFYVEARPLLAELGEPVGLALTLERMAAVALKRADRRTARPLLEERLAICRKLGASELLIHALGGLAHLERDEGNYARAWALYQESLLLRRELGNRFALAQSLEDLAVLAGREQQSERAIRLLGAAEAFCETLDARPPVADATDYQRTVSEGHAALGEAAFAAAWAEGRAMSLEQAVEYALGED